MDFPDLVSVKPLPSYRIQVRYSDGMEGEVDLSYLVGKGVFAFWNDHHNFERVFVSESGAVAWNSDIEICPDSIYMKITGKTVEELLLPSRNALSHV